MISKRREGTIVLTDRHVSVLHNHYTDGSGPSLILQVSQKELIQLGKLAKKKTKFLEGKYPGCFLHLSPEISFFIESKNGKSRSKKSRSR